MAVSQVQRNEAQSYPPVRSLAVALRAPAAIGRPLVSGIIVNKSAGASLRPSAGWVVPAGGTLISTSVSIAVAVRDRATGAAADTCTWSWDTAQNAAACIVEYAGFEAGMLAPFVVATPTNESNVTTVALGPVDTADEAAILALVGADTWYNWGSDATWSGGFTRLVSWEADDGESTDVGGCIAERIVAGATRGVTTTATAVYGGAGGDQASGLLLVLGVPSPTPRVVVREPSDRLAMTVRHVDGSSTRWGPDEVDAADVPGGLTITESMPGGYKTCDHQLLRGLRPRADEGLFDDVHVYGPGRRTVWEGRVAQLPRSATGVQVGAIGWSVHLEDHKGWNPLYINRNLGDWQGPSLERRIALLRTGRSPIDPQLTPDPTSGRPSLLLEHADTWLASTAPQVEATYDGPQPIAALYFAWRISSTINAADANYWWSSYLADNDTYASTDATPNLRAAGPGTALLRATAANRRIALIQFVYSAAGGATGAKYDLFVTCAAAIGDHGLPLQGTGSTTDPPGLLVTDMVKDVVRRGAPLLNVTADSVQNSPVALTHFHPSDGGRTPASDIAKLNAHLGWDWRVGDNRTFYFGPSTIDTVWIARLPNGARPQLEGQQAEDLFNGVIVYWTDYLGRRRIVGPPGATAHTTTPLLQDLNPDNPVNSHGIPYRWAMLELSDRHLDETAIRIGQVFLAEQLRARRRGDFDVVGWVEQRGVPGLQPAWMIRAGHWLATGDEPRSPLRRIIATSYNRPTRTNKLTLDSVGNRVDTLLELLRARLIGVVGG